VTRFGRLGQGVALVAAVAAVAGCEATNDPASADPQDARIDDAHVHHHDAERLDAASTGDAGADAGPVDPGAYVWRLPPDIPPPRVPEENPMTAEKVELGRRLFYDKRLSRNEKQACATCHEQVRAFTDGRPQAIGSTEQHHRRNSMALTNVGYYTALTWANPIIDRLEEQALGPLLGETPVELGFGGREDELFARLATVPYYAEAFPRVFPDAEPRISLATITRAIAAFERTLLSFDSPYDRFKAGDATALTDAQKRGRDLFLSEELECFHCHGGYNFSDSVATVNTTIVETMFHNTGLYNLDAAGAYPATDQGLIEVTETPADMGRFRAVSLRNVAVTGPYMHDGSIATLEEVVDHYAAGGRTIADGPNAGAGHESPLRSEFVNGFEITAEQKADLIAFLQSLTDETFLHDPAFADPWTPEGD
jgi:cytochrome c peroxidase